MFVFLHIIISTCIRNGIPINICICRHAHICIPHHIRIPHVVFPITQTPMQCSWDNAVQTLFNIVQHPLLDRYDSMSNMGSMLTLGILLLSHTSKGMPHQHEDNTERPQAVREQAHHVRTTATISLSLPTESPTTLFYDFFCNYSILDLPRN